MTGTSSNSNRDRSKSPVQRRDALKTAAGGMACLLGAPAIQVKPAVTLRVLGTNVTLQEAIRRQAERDLGFRIQFEAKGSAGVLQKASTQPDAFDVYEQWSNSINVLWDANAIQPIDTARIRRWNEMNGLSKTGRITPMTPEARGDSPSRILNVQRDNSLGGPESGYISFVPYVHNVDSFGYNTSRIPVGTEYESESWGWLLDDQFRGRVGLVNEPAIGIFDAALAAQAKGLVQINDIGDMTRAELDRLFEVLIDFKRHGHFNGLWSSVPQSVQFMKSGRVLLESMFSPAVSELNGMGIPVRYAAPAEGYRAWHGVLCLSSKTSGYVMDAAYDYMNWWLDGWAGAYMAKQGYYISVPEPVRERLPADEWDYWYSGKTATRDLPGADGGTVVKAGARRSGGNYEKRLSNIAVWNTVMNSYEYSLVRWYELLTA